MCAGQNLHQSQPLKRLEYFARLDGFIGVDAQYDMVSRLHPALDFCYQVTHKNIPGAVIIVPCIKEAPLLAPDRSSS
jgi:hypothetical protein